MSVISLLMTFPFIIETDEMFSIYLLTRLVSFGNFLQRVDAIFILLWIFIFLSFLSFNFYCILKLFKKIFNINNSTEMSYSLSSLIIGIALAFKDIRVVKYIFRNYLKVYAVILIFIVSFTILLLAYFKKKKSRRKDMIKNEI